MDSAEVVPDPAPHQISDPPAGEIVDGRPAFTLTFADGRGRLALDSWYVSPLATLEGVALEVPDPSMGSGPPAIGSDGEAVYARRAGPAPDAAADRFRNRRCRLLGATVTVDVARIRREIDRPAIRARLAAAGISDVRLRVVDGAIRLIGRAAIGGREAAFTAHAHLRRQGPRKLRIALDELRTYGFLPVPAPVVAQSILASVFQAFAPASARGAPGWWVDLDPLDMALHETFAAFGWRLPDVSEARMATVGVSAERIALRWTGAGAHAIDADPGDGQRGGQGDGQGDDGGADDAPAEEADGRLARGDFAGALAAYRRAREVRPDDAVAATRALQIMAAGAGTLTEADAAARALLAQTPDDLNALLVRAVCAAERGDAAQAAETYEQLAMAARRRDEEEDALSARLAAIEQWVNAGRTDRARRLADQVLATLPADANGELARVLQMLGELLVTHGDFAEADRVFESRMVLAPDSATAAAIATDRARIRLLGPGGAAAALAVLRDISLHVASEEALTLRADLGERQLSPDDAIPALRELAARARRLGDGPTVQRMDDRTADLLARAMSGKLADDGAATVSAIVARSFGAPDGEAAARAEDLDLPEAPAADSIATADGDDAAAADDLVIDEAPAPSADDLEQLLVTDPTDSSAAENLADIYAQISNPGDRVEALSGLLRRALGLSADRRKAIYASLGESAEASGDLDRAEQAYWRAATIEAEPALRANFLVSHARVLLARGEVQTGIGELEEALALAPDHAGALALLADVTFRTQDWARARQLYARLDAVPGAAEVISRELLMYRRAVLAQSAGVETEAEVYLREVAILNPRHLEARQSLAEIALRRGDFAGAALRLEEVLRLLPLDALDRLLDVRQRLGGIYVAVGDWGSARYYIELVLAQDPARVSALEMLIDVYLRLTLHLEAAQACARLARLYAQPARRAEVLYRQGEILRSEVGDEAGALDAFLRSSDLDPRFAPTLVRLSDFYWQQGGFDDLAQIAGDLAACGFAPEPPDLDLAIRLAIGTRVAIGDVQPPDVRERWTLNGIAWDAPRAARALAEATGFMGARPPADLDAALDLFAGGPRPHDGGAQNGALVGLYQALKDLVQEDPGSLNMGAARTLGRMAERKGQIAFARALYSLLVFVDPDDGAGNALGELGAARPIDPRLLPGAGPLALLANGQPLDALKELARQDPLAGASDDPADREPRRGLLRTSGVRELVRYLLSAEYEIALAAR
jgi:tetratricopeptide (TPR) repeat protein